jgi:hypothetical protein
MTSSVETSREELLELAPLEALGLLDEVDERRFDISFDEAAPTVQDEVRDLQAAVAAEFGSAGSESPDRSLRYRVLAALSSAVEEDDQQCAPIAAIGSPRAFQRNQITESNPSAAKEIDPKLAEAIRRERYARSSLIWRAASIALGCGLLVTLFFAKQLTQDSKELVELALSNSNSMELREKIGPTYGEFLNSSTSVVHSMASVDPATISGGITIFIEPKTQEGLLLGFGLAPTAGQYRLYVVDPTTKTEKVLRAFTPAQALAAVGFSTEGIGTGSIYEIRDANDSVVFSMKSTLS